MSATLEDHRQSFEDDPGDNRAFEALDEHHFLAGEWEELVTLYRRRADAPTLEDQPAVRVAVLFRLGQLLEERCLRADDALECYWEVARLDPQCRPALRQARQIHAQRSQWDLVLQIAELEGEIPMEPYEKAAFLSEMGDIWLAHLSDPAQALECFDGALETNAGMQDALAGRARCLQELGRLDEAVTTWELLTEAQRGPDRAPTLVSLAELMAGRMGEPDRAAELYRRAITEDPRNQDAVEALVQLATSREQWPLLADLYERQFDLAAGARRRTAIALEAGRLHLDHLDHPQAARMWLDRAVELCPDDADVQRARADLERRAGNGDALLEALDQVISLDAEGSSTSIVVEAAQLHSHAGNEERARAHLELAHQSAPNDPRVLEALSATLAKLGRGAELAEILEQRASLAGNDLQARVAALRQLGRIYDEDLADTEAALDAYMRAFDAQPDAPEIASTLELLCRKAEAWEPLRAVLERASREGPAEERLTRACALGELLDERFDDQEGATRAFEAALEFDPGFERGLRGLERIALATGNEELALRAYEREAAVTSDPGRLAHLVWELDRLLEERGRQEDALHWLEKLLQAVTDDRRALETAARLHDELGQGPEQIPLLEQLDRLMSGAEQAENSRRLARLERDANHLERATHWLEAAVEIEPDHLESLQELKGFYEDARRLEDVARLQRRIAEQLPPAERAACLDQLATLLEEQLGDLDGAVVVLWRLSALDDRPERTEERLEDLLERAGRFEELAQRLLERSRSLAEADGEEAIRIDLRHAWLLLDRLAQYEEAAAMFRSVRERAPSCGEALDGLEKTLRAGNDPGALAELLAERAREETDPCERARREFECAVLLEEASGDLERARDAYAALADDAADATVSAESAARLEALLERCGEWAALRERLESGLGRGTPEQDLVLRERLASLCRDRLGDAEGCIAHLEAAGQLTPDRSDIWRNLGLLYQENDRPGDLGRVIEAELATSPDPQRELVLRSQAARLCTDADQGDAAARHFERALELDPCHSEASEFLIEHYEGQNRGEDVVRLLEARLDRAPEDFDSEADRARRTALRLRIAALRADRLDDPEGAILVLEPALLELGPVAVIAEALADLYQCVDRRDDLIELGRRACAACDEPEGRASWLLRLGRALRERGSDPDRDEAVEVYRRALAERPDDRDASGALRELYREREEAGPLAELLQTELERTNLTPEARVSLRMELAEILGEQLDRREEALHQLHSVLTEDPRNTGAFERAAGLAEALGRHDDRLALLEDRLARPCPSDQRAALLERKGDLLAGPIGRPEDAATTYREALSLAAAPDARRMRRALRGVLETLGRWPAVLDCLYMEARTASGAGEDRAAILETGVEIARRELSSDAALPWLERLRAERSDDPRVVASIADVHRQAGRPEALLRALEDELALTNDPGRQRELHLERARVLERDLESPGRAISAVEAARETAPDDLEALDALDRLYGQMGRVRDRVQVLEARIARQDPSASAERVALHRSAALLYVGSLANPEAAAAHLLCAISLSVHGSDEHRELLRELSGSLRATGWMEAWARATEVELALLGSAPTLRGLELRRELAWIYERDLADPQAALLHLSALVDGADAEPRLERDAFDQVERALLARLRADHSHLELERRLAARLARGAGYGDGDEWLELARLRDEQLHAPAGGRDAYREVLSRRPGDRAAIRGLRNTAERLGDWSAVAHGLDLELEQGGSTHEQSALLRRLGDVCWHRLDDRERAASAFTRALETEPGDLHSLRSLERLAESRGARSAALDLYDREIQVLDDCEPERRQWVWLRIGALARDESNDEPRALRAYERAAEIADLEPEATREWAELYRSADNRERFADTFGRWCDQDGSGAGCRDHLELACALEELGRGDAALVRATRAIGIDSASAEARDVAARLHEARGDVAEAADCLERAADLLDGGEATHRLMRAALLVERTESERAFKLLGHAVERDASCAEAWAHRARTAADLEKWDESETSAGRALDAGNEGTLPHALHFETAMCGGRAALEQTRLEPAARFFATATSLDPEHGEALEAEGETLAELGDLAGARRALERRLELPGENPRRARHLTVVACALEMAGDADAALGRFRDALAADAGEAEAHAGVVRLHEGACRIDDAVAAIEAWAAVAPGQAGAAALWLRAAEVELADGRAESAERHLRQSVSSDVGSTRAWLLLAEHLWDADRGDEALETATQALEHVEDGAARARLALACGRALDQRDDAAAAAEAYGAAATGDPRCSEACLAQARLLRAQGHWAEAAETLQTFARLHPEPEDPSLAAVHHERGRLMAGPLEDMNEAIRCYERAVLLRPDLTEAREPLARLLTHVPERWCEAVEHHRALLHEDPLRLASLRDLLALSRERREDAVDVGLALLRALGIASPEERERAPAHVPLTLASEPRLEPELWEQLRRAALEASSELGETLATVDATEPASSGEPGHPAEAFLSAMRRAEGELASPTLVPLSDEDLGVALTTLAALALDPGSVRGAGPESEAMDRALGRWTRRKVRRALDGFALDEVVSIDFGLWRQELRALAAATALDQLGGDLRGALLALTEDPEERAGRDLSDAADLRALVSGSPLAKSLVRRCVSAWCTQLAAH